MNSTLRTVLELQITSIQDVQRNIVAILQNDYQEKFDNISIPSSISDPKTLVNHFSPVTTVTRKEIDASHDASSCDSSIHFKPKTTSETKVVEDVNQTTEASSRHCAYMVRSNRDQTDKDSEIKSGVYISEFCKMMMPTGPLDNSAVSYAEAFKATPKKKKISADTSDSFENSEID